jgi:hypothetical protein
MTLFVCGLRVGVPLILAGAMSLANPGVCSGQAYRNGGNGILGILGGLGRGRSYAPPRGGGAGGLHFFSPRGFSSVERFLGNRLFNGQGRGGSDYRRFFDHNRGWYRGSPRSYGYYGAPYRSYFSGGSYVPDYGGYYAPYYRYPYPACNPAGFYDAWGRWFPDPNCRAGYYRNGYGYGY